MDPRITQTRVELFEELCRARGTPFTVQRRTILEAVLNLDGHPTSEAVHEAVAARTPGISRTTIYRTLETLVRMGVISRLSHPGSAVRYDTRLEVHHHLVCESCDDVVDITDARLDALPIPDTSALGFDVHDLRVQLRGTCRRCREQKEERS